MLESLKVAELCWTGWYLGALHCRHKERYVFSVLVKVTRVMGMGQDSVFMGVLEVGEQQSEDALD
jgi:hypothetical protein